MFTGIIQCTAQLVAVKERSYCQTHVVQFPPELLPQLEPGASVSHNGCCLTVTRIERNMIHFDLIKETLRLTNLGQLGPGDWINLERSARLGDEIGGHLMSGHVVCTAEIIKIYSSENARKIWLRLPVNLMKYVLHKGFIGVDGISLTVGEVIRDQFCLHIIPETLARTTLGSKRPGQKVNIEIDAQTQAIVDTVERVLSHQNKSAMQEIPHQPGQ